MSVEQDMVMLEGTTNLPDGSLVSFELDHEEDLNVFDNAKIEVEDGSFYHEVDISGYPAGQVLIQSFILLNDLPEDDALYDGIFMKDYVFVGEDVSEDLEHDRKTLYYDLVTYEKEEVIPPFEAVTYAGSGDDFFPIEKPDGIFILRIDGNSASRHFAVRGFDDAGNATKLFVNTTDSYSGTVLDLEVHTSYLEVSAAGDWEIVIDDLAAASIMDESYQGHGDDVLLYLGSSGVASITGNSAERHFAVKAYHSGGRDLLVNTTDNYAGTVRVDSSSFIFEITGTGDWEIVME
ncbi:hypothetical protein BBEV_3147 [Salisediminibacterium beveridgei]|uniref:Uncharacterized protein n=1 Tax=Salisediminibacterium beveridgei TaxID=632773 RepID=A0A1D7QZM9_9BACI|nr:hypothetical protein BBEV_3147 [Salisediminibacterium beveridgei]